jgi:hydroxyethylthiazole kinase
MSLLEQIAAGIDQIRNRKPIVHHITNYISINDCANVTLAIGASPIMANDPAEVAEVVSQSAALVLNLGTPNTRMMESMLIAGKQANELGIPVILDPVGMGFTQVRTRAVEQIALCIRLTAVRGNLAEIQRMAGVYAAMRGIDSLAADDDAAETVCRAAQQMGCWVAATGPTDYISDGRNACRVSNGDSLMSRVTGTGCMTTSLVAAFCGAMGPSLASVSAGVMLMGIAGEMARASLRPGEGTGTFRIRLMDAVSILTAGDILRQGRCTVESLGP